MSKSQSKKIERFNKKHPEGRKAFSNRKVFEKQTAQYEQNILRGKSGHKPRARKETIKELGIKK